MTRRDRAARDAAAQSAGIQAIRQRLSLSGIDPPSAQRLRTRNREKRIIVQPQASLGSPVAGALRVAKTHPVRRMRSLSPAQCRVCERLQALWVQAGKLVRTIGRLPVADAPPDDDDFSRGNRQYDQRIYAELMLRRLIASMPLACRQPVLNFCIFEEEASRQAGAHATLSRKIAAGLRAAAFWRGEVEADIRAELIRDDGHG